MNELLKNKYFRLFILLIIFGIIINIGYRKYKIEGDSMNATYKEGETLYVDKTTYKITTPERGDVVYHYDEPDVLGLVVDVKDPGMWNKAEIVWEGSNVSEWLFTKCLKVLDKADN